MCADCCEETGFINQVGEWVLLEACRQMVAPGELLQEWGQDERYAGHIAVS